MYGNLPRKYILSVKLDMRLEEVPQTTINRDCWQMSDVPLWRRKMWLEKINNRLKTFARVATMEDLFPASENDAELQEKQAG
jgi:cell fate regulator YaaT (PSP1 superfamily)